MSPIASLTSIPDIRVVRTAPVAAAVPVTTATEAPAPVRPAPVAVTPDAVRDGRFDAAATRVHAVRQAVQQIAGLAYGAHVSVVNTASGVHATIDVSA